tara:strand:+ start:223 stop:1392 length:1170 start_codon:yes stop_codon:yes gene_type:complete
MQEILDKDPISAQKERAEKVQSFVNDVSQRAAQALGASDDPAIAAAQERVKLANKMLDYMKTGNTAKSERENAKKVAGSFLVSVSRGTDSTAALNKALQSMKTLEGLDMLAEEINLQRQGMRAVDSATAARQREAAKNSGDPEAVGGFTAADITSIDRAMDPQGYFSTNRARREADPNFPRSLEGFTPEQMRMMKDGDYDLALREAKQALTNLEQFPGMQEMMLTIARQSAPDAESVVDAFDKISGMTAEQAAAQDKMTLSEQERAMEYISRTGRYDLLTSNKTMRDFMESSGLNAQQLPRYLQNRYRIRREQNMLTDQAAKEVPGPFSDPVVSLAESSAKEEKRAADSMIGLKASTPEPIQPTAGGVKGMRTLDREDVDEEEDSGLGS